ncbi:MAG: hypothetical protein F6K11_10180 [Leptolyngbya sp. SIO3F4]|nr:hypothetical protein [Leptolyngbya sp. SIO3F4]
MNFDAKQTLGQFFLSMGAVGIVLVSPSSVSYAEIRVTKHELLEFITSKNIPVSKQEQPDFSEFDRYGSSKFSLNYPKGWQIEPQGENSWAIISPANGANMAIRTNIVMLREDPKLAVPQRLNQITTDALSVQSYSLVTVDGQSGLRISYESETGQRALVTFVGYGNQQTVILTSRYSQERTAETTVTQIHDSFVNHSIIQSRVSD